MKKNYHVLMSMLLFFIMHASYAQDSKGRRFDLGDSKNFLNQLKQDISTSNQRRSGPPSVELKVSESKTLSGKVNYQKAEGENGHYVVGEIQGASNSSFFIRVENNSVEGNIILKKTKQAYKYYSDAQGNAYVQEEDIHDVICIDYDHASDASSSTQEAESPVVAMALTNLESYPGGNGCVLLDFDGQYVSGTPWNNGNPINAQPSGMSDAAILESWEIVSEDFRPFHLNVTTSEAVFNSYPKTRRMRCIITPTNTAAPGAGGVAYIGSFRWNDDTPCWVFITSAKGSAEASSHEIGHTFGLGHDGRTSPSEGYYRGHGDWAPIMGVGYYEPITQWSKGEYANANNTEDDLAKISSSTYAVGYRADDHGNSTSSATALNHNASGVVSASQNQGIIERTTDLDFFSFTTSGGNVSLNFNPAPRHGNLDILVRLYNQSGTQIGTYNPSGLASTMNVNLAQGTYYISVDGTGVGNPATDGYSDYASLGSFSISGTIPVGTVSLRDPENPSNTVAGLDYKYYEGNWTALPDFNSLTPAETGNVSNFDLSVRNRNDQFGFSFTGFINVPSDGQYTFYTSSDDGSKLFIGSTLVVNNDGLHGAQERSGTIGLKAGKHAVTVTFFEQGGSEVLNVSYAGPGITKQAVPSSALFRNAPVVTCGVPSSLTASNITTSSATLSWSAQAGAVSYLVWWRPVGGDWGPNTTVTGNSANVTGLQGATQYEFTVRSNCSGTSSGYASPYVRFTTSTPNVAPVVSITSPANNASFTAPANITISASASDSDGSISKVEFFNGSIKLGEDLTNPYSFTWNNVAAGSYTLTAKATDNSGALTASSAITIQVAPAPQTIGTLYQHCNYSTAGYVVGLNEGNYTLSQLISNGIMDNDVSSLKVQSGYEIVLYELDNFQGAFQVFQSDDACLVDNGINDWVSSIRIRPAGCNLPSSLSASGITTNSATLSWSAQSGAVSYMVWWRRVGADWGPNTTVTGNSVNVTGLESATQYEFTVRTNCQGASSEYASVFRFTTLTPSTFGINGPSCTSPGTPTVFTLNPDAGTVTSASWWTSGDATITPDPSDPKKVTVTYTANATGSVTINCGANLSSAPWYKQYSKTFTVGSCTPLDMDVTITASPISFNNETTVSITNGEYIHTLKLYDMKGNEILSLENVNVNEVPIGQDLRAGIYILTALTDSGNYYTHRIVKH